MEPTLTINNIPSPASLCIVAIFDTENNILEEKWFAFKPMGEEGQVIACHKQSEWDALLAKAKESGKLV